MDNSSVKDQYDMMKDALSIIIDDCKRRNTPIYQMLEVIGMSCWACAKREKEKQK